MTTSYVNGDQDIFTPLPITVSYYGESLTHPGISISTELCIINSEGHKLVAPINLGFYIHIRNHTGLFIVPEIGYRYTFFFGLAGEVLIGCGYLHTFLGAPVYERIDGEMKETTDYGRPSFISIAELGLGYDFTKIIPSFPVLFFIRNGIFLQYPFNENFLIHQHLQIGITYYLDI